MKNRRKQPAKQNRAEARTAKPANAPAQPVKIEKVVQIEKAIYGGSFLAHADGKAVFVPLVLPGEEAKVRIKEEKRGYATAEVEEMVAAAAERIAPACRHFGTCGGCNYQHAGYATQLGLKQAILRETLERGGVRAPDEINLLAGSETQAWGYRNRIRIAFDAQGNAGYRGRRSNAVTPIAECPIAAPLLVRAALAFADVARIAAPHLRAQELLLFCDAAEAALLATVFVRNADKSVLDALAKALHERVPELKGMELAAAPDERSNEQSPRTLARWGDTYLIYRAAAVEYRVDHGAFFQVNRWLVDGLVEQVMAGRSGATAWDLFAGVGLFARKLTASYERVVAVESAPAAMPGLEANLRGTHGTAVRAWTLDFLRSRKKADRPDLIVVDPPRAGLGAEMTSALADVAAPMMTYVSCDPATLARDLRALTATGYAIESVTLADLFPQTFHLETVVHLRRS
jgi:23S rRNA (uracil1939-C5)-methyltransferase